MFKGAHGWEHDFRAEGRQRWHVRYGPNKKVADVRHEVAVAVWRARDEAVIQAVRDGAVTLDQLIELRWKGEAFAKALDAAHQPWPTLGAAVEAYTSWLDGNQKKRPGTARAAKTQLNRALAAFGSDVRLDAITAQSVTEWQTAMAATYAANYVTATVGRLGTLYRWHISREAIAAREGKRAPRTLWIPLNADEISQTRTRRERFLSKAEAAKVLEAAPSFFRFPVACGLYAGLRVDEMLHLRPAFDVDESARLLRIQEQPKWKPKTTRSIRRVPISDALWTEYQRHTAAHSNAQWVTPAWRNAANPFNRHTFEDHFRTIVENAGLVAGRKDRDGVTFHTLRHTFASHLLMAGVDIYTAAQLLGDTVKMVESTYGHLSQDHTAEAVGKLTYSTEGGEK